MIEGSYLIDFSLYTFLPTTVYILIIICQQSDASDYILSNSDLSQGLDLKGS